MSFANVHVSNHPVLLHKLSIMRRKDTTQPMYRQLLRELSFYLGYEITASLTVKPVAVEGTHGSSEQSELAERVALIPVMRAGLGMVDPIMELLPTSRVHHLGMYHESLTDCCVMYYNRLPAEVDADVAVVLEPVVGSGATMESVLYILKQWGVKKIKVMSLIATKHALNKVAKSNPDVQFHVGAIDEGDSSASVNPGIGDCGDRLFGTYDRKLIEAENAAIAASEAKPAAAAATPVDEGKGAKAKGTKRGRA